MPPKKAKAPLKRANNASAVIENAGIVVEQPITSTLEKNFMPYAMSVILSRAIPEIDGLKPSHRKLLYTMYKMGLLNGSRTKSANIVGQTMKLNPHGDQAIYETMVRLARGNESLLHPYVDSKGNFGKAYSRDMAYAASRYTEAKLEPICKELFADIDKDTVDFVDNYDNKMKEPTILPVTFPSILVNSNMGIAVGMASSICSFNLAELCEVTIARLKDPKAEIREIMKAPDFPSGGYILYNKEEMDKVFSTGRGSVRVRSRYNYDKENNCIDVTEIPPTTTVEAIIDKIIDLVKSGKIREISDIRDETDLSGLKLTIDLKRGVDAQRLMQKLYRMTPLEDSFACNFNILIGGTPMVLGVEDILREWIAFREQSVRRRVFFDLKRKQEKRHLLEGLQKILLDIDKAIRIVRETEQETEVVPNLMIGFGVDQIQAEYVAEIRLRQLNREYVLNRIQEIESLNAEIEEMQAILDDPKRIKKIISDELKNVAKKYGQPRKSLLLYQTEEEEETEEEEIPDYAVNLILTRESYFKKITPQSLRMSSEHKLKEGDAVTMAVEDTNSAHLLFFTDRQQVYKARASEFEDTKASVMGDFLPAKLGMDDGEQVIAMIVTHDYKGYLFFFFENGRAAKVDLSAYETKTKRRKLVSAYCEKFPLVSVCMAPEDTDILMKADSGRVLVFHSSILISKSQKNTQGVVAMNLRKNAAVTQGGCYQPGSIEDEHRFYAKALPSAGAFPRQADHNGQLSLE